MRFFIKYFYSLSEIKKEWSYSFFMNQANLKIFWSFYVIFYGGGVTGRGNSLETCKYAGDGALAKTGLVTFIFLCLCDFRLFIVSVKSRDYPGINTVLISVVVSISFPARSDLSITEPCQSVIYEQCPGTSDRMFYVRSLVVFFYAG